MRSRLVSGLLCVMCHSLLGQDALQRSEQFKAEAELMNSPSTVFFSATLVESFEKTDQIVMSRSVGRRVVGLKGEVRVDVRISRSDLTSGAESIQFEHFIRFGPKDFKKAIGLFGSNLTIFEFDEKVKQKDYKPSAPHGFNNPFLVVLGGDRYFTDFSNEGFITDIAIERLDNALTPASLPKATVVKLFTYSEEIPWAPVMLKFAVNPKKYDHVVPIGKNRFKYDESHLPNWADLKKPNEYIKDWHLLTTITTDWVRVNDIGAVPCRIISQTNSNRDAKRKADFEVHYFGYDFDPKPAEKLFDRKRFNNANIREDFPIESILEQAEKAKKASQSKATRMSGRP